MAKTVALLACLLAAALASAQRPLPITADEAGPGPIAASPQPVRRATASPDVPAAAAPAAAAAAPAATPAVERPGCSLGGFHAVGESWPTSGRDGCVKYTCQRSGVVSSQPCPRVLAPEGCSAKDGDVEALFPACCPQRECSPGVPVPPVLDVPVASGAVVLPAVDVVSTTPSSSSSSTSTTTEAPSSTTPAAA